MRQLGSLVRSGRLAPGARLPGERELARALAVSRPSLREALRALSLLGIVENKPGTGTFLAAPSRRSPLEHVSMFLSIKRGVLLDIFEARKSLEATTAALAARRRSADDLRAMAEALGRMEACLASPGAYDRFELRFHRAVAAAAGNPVITDLMEKIYQLLRHSRSRFYRDVTRRRAYLREDCGRHRLIFESIQTGNERRAAGAMTDHLLRYERMLTAELATGGTPQGRAGRANGLRGRG